MKHAAVLTLTLLTGLASAQQGAQSTRTQMTPEMRARMAQMQPVLDLAETVRLLPELEKNKATAVSKAQARSLLSILTTLQKPAAVSPNDAKKYLTQIEDKILSDKQLTALDSLMLKAEQERAARRAQTQRSGQTGRARIPGMPFGAVGQNAGGQNRSGQTQGGQNQAGQGTGGRPGQFNPFRQGRTADALNAYVKVLQKK
ncbi:hypothetical protein [Deinococcus hohokamensis]|uniref:DUF3300 domain-containing protein n=1 Tax=Deinococcus hohokamensis TaxID=309883 RepID=A0ABV9I8V3_9DEIO